MVNVINFVKINHLVSHFSDCMFIRNHSNCKFIWTGEGVNKFFSFKTDWGVLLGITCTGWKAKKTGMEWWCRMVVRNGGAEYWQNPYFKIAHRACVRFYYLKLRLMLKNFTFSQDMKKGSILRENSSNKIFDIFFIHLCDWTGENFVLC